MRASHTETCFWPNSGRECRQPLPLKLESLLRCKNVGKQNFQPSLNKGDVGFSSPCRGVHYGAGVTSFCLCGQRLIYLAERIITPGTSPRGASHRARKPAPPCTSQPVLYDEDMSVSLPLSRLKVTDLLEVVDLL